VRGLLLRQPCAPKLSTAPAPSAPAHLRPHLWHSTLIEGGAAQEGGGRQGPGTQLPPPARGPRSCTSNPPSMPEQHSTNTHTHTHAHTHMHTHVHTHAHTHAHTLTRTHTQIHTHAHTHTHTHAPALQMSDAAVTELPSASGLKYQGVPAARAGGVASWWGQQAGGSCCRDAWQSAAVAAPLMAAHTPHHTGPARRQPPNHAHQAPRPRLVSGRPFLLAYGTASTLPMALPTAACTAPQHVSFNTHTPTFQAQVRQRQVLPLRIRHRRRQPALRP